jgi:hypothetical protein
MSQPVMVGYRGGPAYNVAAETWFSPAFLALGRVDAPACVWESDGSYVRRTFKAGSKWAGLRTVWRLTDERDEDGFRLGVWPD